MVVDMVMDILIFSATNNLLNTCGQYDKIRHKGNEENKQSILLFYFVVHFTSIHHRLNAEKALDHFQPTKLFMNGEGTRGTYVNVHKWI